MERRRLTRDKVMSGATAQTSTAATDCGSTGTENVVWSGDITPLLKITSSKPWSPAVAFANSAMNKSNQICTNTDWATQKS